VVIKYGRASAPNYFDVQYKKNCGKGATDYCRTDKDFDGLTGGASSLNNNLNYKNVQHENNFSDALLPGDKHYAYRTTSRKP
jgi:hypothetical protein